MRNPYVDKLKGVAIIFVVMGHITEWSLGVRQSPFNLFYESFHMPLFMFLSGLFAYKSFIQWDIQEILVFFRKKALRLLLPFLTIGGGYSLLISDGVVIDYVKTCAVYWFFPALFYCMLAGMFISMINSKVNSKVYKVYIDILLFGVLMALSYFLIKTGIGHRIPYYKNFNAMFPFFYFGALTSRYGTLRNLVVNSERMYLIAIICYMIAMLCMGGARKYAGCFAIVILLQLFIKNDKYIPSIFSKVGLYSLEIYAFHWFFLPVFPSFQNIVSLSQIAGVANSNFVLLLMLSLCLAIPIIGVCIGITKCIRESHYLNAFFFGYKSKKL